MNLRHTALVPCWLLLAATLAGCGKVEGRDQVDATVPDAPPAPDVDRDGDGAPSSVDCNDGDKAIHPGAVETCNGVDDNCDGTRDETLLGTQACPATSCKAILASKSSTGNGTYHLRLGDVRTQAYCDMEGDGGGWTLVFHVFDLGGTPNGLAEQQFIDRYGHNRWTDESWVYLRSTNRIEPASVGPVPLATQGALDIDLVTDWNDLRMACSTASSATQPEHWVIVDGYATTNGNHRLLGAVPNGKLYEVPITSNTVKVTKIWHDNEPTSSNGYHYLCDTLQTAGNPAAQFGFCYTDFLNDDNAKDMGDSIVTIAFGSAYGPDTWSTGFTAECGNMKDAALQNAGTFGIWVR